jgi:hypothetical protein
MITSSKPAPDVPTHPLFAALTRQQPRARYSFAGCAKDGSEGPPPKTPPPPPPSDPVDIRDLVEQVVRQVTAGQMVVRVKPGAGFLGIERAPLEFVAPGTARISADRERRAFMVRYVDRGGDVDEDALPDVILDHAMRLRALSDDGALESAATYASGTGALQILLVPTRAEAERIAGDDPLLRAGYYRGFEIDELLPSWIGDC